MTQISALSVIINGVETQLASLGALVKHVGWGSTKQDTYSLRAPGQHGDTWGGFALAPRIGSLIFRMQTTDLDAMYTLRNTLLTLFSPLAAPTLKFVTPNGARCFDCHFYDNLSLDWDVSDWAAQKIGIVLKASDPTCYDPTGAGWTFSLGGGADMFTVPYSVPYKMGASSINQSQTITYPGNWGSFPLIRITGPITNPIITNLGTSEVLDFTGTTIAAGDWYDIDCRFGLKMVNDAAGVNRVAKLTTASNLSTFHLGANPQVVGGINPVNVSGSAITVATSVSVSYFVRYLGV